MIQIPERQSPISSFRSLAHYSFQFSCPSSPLLARQKEGGKRKTSQDSLSSFPSPYPTSLPLLIQVFTLALDAALRRRLAGIVLHGPVIRALDNHGVALAGIQADAVAVAALAARGVAADGGDIASGAFGDKLEVVVDVAGARAEHALAGAATAQLIAVAGVLGFALEPDAEQAGVEAVEEGLESRDAGGGDGDAE